MSVEAATAKVSLWQQTGHEVVFTNGCFDLLHAGHLQSLHQARALGDKLIVGLNADISVQKLKGPHRPITDEQSRALGLAALECVDGVVIFEQDTPLEIIELLSPDILAKGGDYTPENVVGANHVIENGGKVVILPLLEGFSTTGIVAKMERK